MVSQAFSQTIYMIFVSTCIGVILGTPIGGMLFWFSRQGFHPNNFIYLPLHFFVNTLRSIPFIILMVLFIPLMRIIVGTSIGTTAAIVPLALSAVILMARMTEETLMNMPRSIIEVGYSLGASSFKVIRKILIPEALPQLVQGITNVLITMVAYSAMAGVIGGGGLGDLANRYGYQRYDMGLLFVIVAILILMVQTIQIAGDFFYKSLKK